MSAAKTTAGTISVSAVVLLLATNGEELFTALKAGWEFVSLVTKEMPFALGSVLLGWAIGVGLLAYLRHAFPAPSAGAKMHLRLALVEPFAMFMAWAVVFVQAKNLTGGLVGLLAALLVPWTYRILAALGSALKRNWSVG